MKRLVGALLLSAGLILGGCASQPAAQNPSAAGQAQDGNVAFKGWVRDAIDSCREKGTDNGMVVQVTGLITKGYSAETVGVFTIVDPTQIDEKAREADGMADIVYPEDADEITVLMKDSLDATRWPRLVTLRGTLSMDGDNPHKATLSSAVEAK